MAASGKLHQLWCKNLRIARKRAKLTQEEAGKRMGVSGARYCEIETGRFEPVIGIQERAAAAVRATPQELLDPEFAAELVS